MAESVYLDVHAVAARLGIAVRTVYDYRTTGRLPKPDAVFGRSPAWLPTTIERHAASLRPTANVHRTREAS